MQDNDNKFSEIEELKELKELLLKDSSENITRVIKGCTKSQNLVYKQLESLSWLQRRLLPNTQLPPLRGWASSPDVLVLLHTHIIEAKPAVIVEFGSGASTLVIADALCQNSTGKLFSIEHSDIHGTQTLSQLQQNNLQDWVDLRIGELEPWNAEHINSEVAEKPSVWYSKSLVKDINNIDLVWVDGPPGNTCLYSRYPALPALSNQLSNSIEIWMDDTVRKEETNICENWAKEYGFDVHYYPLEKGLGRLTVPSKES